jgi:hypothetical protein
MPCSSWPAGSVKPTHSKAAKKTLSRPPRAGTFIPRLPLDSVASARNHRRGYFTKQRHLPALPAQTRTARITAPQPRHSNHRPPKTARKPRKTHLMHLRCKQDAPRSVPTPCLADDSDVCILFTRGVAKLHFTLIVRRLACLHRPKLFCSVVRLRPFPTTC